MREVSKFLLAAAAAVCVCNTSWAGTVSCASVPSSIQIQGNYDTSIGPYVFVDGNYYYTDPNNLGASYYTNCTPGTYSGSGVQYIKFRLTTQNYFGGPGYTQYADHLPIALRSIFQPYPGLPQAINPVGYRFRGLAIFPNSLGGPVAEFSSTIPGDAYAGTICQQDASNPTAVGACGSNYIVYGKTPSNAPNLVLQDGVTYSVQIQVSDVGIAYWITYPSGDGVYSPNTNAVGYTYSAYWQDNRVVTVPTGNVQGSQFDSVSTPNTGFGLDVLCNVGNKSCAGLPVNVNLSNIAVGWF